MGGNLLWSKTASDSKVVPRDLAEGAKLLFGLAFRSGYTRTFQATLNQQAPGGLAECVEEH